MCVLQEQVAPAVIPRLAELHGDLSSRHDCPLKAYVLWRSTKEVNTLCPTTFVVDATENSEKGGVTAGVCNAQTRL